VVLTDVEAGEAGLLAQNGLLDNAAVTLGVGATSVTVARRAIAMSALTPKNGPRQLMSPSNPPSSGPTAMPRPSAVS